MYDNYFTWIFLSNDFMASLGIVKYYDVFTWVGFFNWWLDSLKFFFLWPWEIYLATVRADTNDWNSETIELINPVDMNRNFFEWYQSHTPDPYDYVYWSSKIDGVDCNGIVGKGNYCYCPS